MNGRWIDQFPPEREYDLEIDEDTYELQMADAAAAQAAAASAAESARKAEEIAQGLREEIPTKVSELENDSNYAVDANYVHTDNNFTSSEKNKLEGIAAGAEVNVNADWNATSGDAFIRNKPTKVSDFDNDVGYLTEHQDISGKANAADLAAVATSGSYNDLLNKPSIPNKVSDLIDDSGHYTKPVTGIPASDLEETYLTEHQDISGKANIPFIINVRKENNNTISDKTFEEIQNAFNNNQELICITDRQSSYTPPDGNKFIFSFLDYSEQVDHLAAIQFESTYITTVNNKNYFVKSVMTFRTGEVVWQDNFYLLPTKTTDLTNDAGYITGYTETDPTVPAWAKASTKPSYTASEVGAPTVQEMNTAINNAIGNVNSFDVAVVQVLPSENISTHTIYLVPKTGETNDVYDEYIYINNAWEMVGNTQIDLSNYATKSEIPDVPVEDVQINGTSIVNNGIAEIPVRSNVVGGSNDLVTSHGINNTLTGIISTSLSQIKDGSIRTRLISPLNQHQATFYGLAKIAGHDEKDSTLPVGQYTDEAKTAIQQMLDVPDKSQLDDCVTKDSLDNAGIMARAYTTIMEETVTTASDETHLSPYKKATTTYDFDKRYLYRVTFDGMEYVLPCQLHWRNNSANTQIGYNIYEYIGNLSLYTSVTGATNDILNVPFVFVNNVVSSNAIEVLTQTAGEHSVKIEKIINTIMAPLQLTAFQLV